MRKHLLTVIGTVFFAAVLFVIAWGIASQSRDTAEEEIASIRNAVYERALQCYVIEGVYPETLAYLEENYGLTLNQTDYRIIYRSYAQNLPPDIRVIDRKEGQR